MTTLRTNGVGTMFTNVLKPEQQQKFAFHRQTYTKERSIKENK